MKRQKKTVDLEAIEQQVLQIIRDVVRELGTDRAVRAVALDASLDKDLGLGSLERVELLARLEKTFSVHLPDQLISEVLTPRDLVHAIYKSLSGKEVPPLLIRREHQAPLEGVVQVPMSASTLQEVLRFYAEKEPLRPHIYLQLDDEKEQIITYGQLFQSSTTLAHGLSTRGLRPAETVGIMLPTGRDFFSAFFGVLLAGGVPVPIYPPYRADRIEEYAKRQAGILRNAGVRILMTFHGVETLAHLLKPFVPSLMEVTTVDRLTASHSEISLQDLPQGFRAEDTALIQYTSGSTAEPKGVQLTHSAILANIRAVGEAARIGPTDVGVSWLPLYHDMGLIGSWLCSLHYGIPITILSPLSFLSRPERWLWAIHYHRATLSPAPNFAYELCVRRIENKAIEGLDLSSWRIAFNGAEPVNPDTLTRFTQRFAAYGFRPEVLLPVYGLAESSVALTFPPLGRPPRVDRIQRETFQRDHRAELASPSDPSPLRFVSCGVPLPGHEVRIVDEQDRDVGERIEGALQFRGPSSMTGYFNNPEATQAVFHNGWWDSGDLAYQADGEIFVTGRRKDVIIKAGRNLYPQEVEAVVGEVAGVRKGCAAVFGITDPEAGTEKLVVVAETRERDPIAHEKITGEVIEQITTAIGIPPDHVFLVPPGVVPKTSSGKLRRYACREAYLRGELAHRRPPAWLQVTKLFLAGVMPRLQRGLHSLSGLAYGAFAWGMAALTIPPVWLAMALVPKGRSAAILSRLWARSLLWLVGCPLSVEGRHHLGRGKAMILVSNHASYLDAIALMAALPPGYVFVAKQELIHAPIIRTFIRKVGHLTVDRLDFSKSVSDTKRIEEALEQGLSVLIFPEGTFSTAVGLRPFKLGAFKVAAETSKPICPISVCGTRQILWAERWLPRRGSIKVVIGPPIQPKGKDWQEITRLRDTAREEIARHCGEQLLDLVSAGPQRNSSRE